MKTDNPYCPVMAEILDVIEETPTIKTFKLKPERAVSFETGQFVEMTVPGLGEAPFTPSSNPITRETMDLTIMNVGRVTSRLHEMKAGEAIGVRGPYGKGYPLDKFKGRELLIVGGGVGLAPLRSLILALLNSISDYKKVVIKYGARLPKDIVYKEEVKRWKENKALDVELTVDKGDESWKGNVGVITTILKDDMGLDSGSGIAIVCGPPIMMKFSTFKLLELGFKHENIYLSMEKNMSCGIGKCGHCRIGPYYACKDGPVFTYEAVKPYHNIWE
ncbi:MAG: FAD/NAD(P)-binding protein [Candidatus Omnitrophica bacterium]|nr:FAD/NAD(P)-binding protein [Candidatus Omnitrophota bacterium]